MFEPFIEGLSSDFTPNPDILCNREVKFGAMRDFVFRKDSPFRADMIATGHYARLAHNENELSDILNSNLKFSYDDEKWLNCAHISRPDVLLDNSQKSPLLLAALDKRKDQSYFLCGTKGQSFKDVLFPLGDLHKSSESSRKSKEGTVREIALSAKLPTASKRESMGICFIGKRSFPKFVREYLPSSCEAVGPFVCVDTGEVVGFHNGSYKYTIGQGAKISGSAQKWFVCRKDAESGNIMVCSDTHHPALYVDEFYVDISKINWIGGSFINALSSTPLEAWCRIRHQQPLNKCLIIIRDGKLVMYPFRPLRAVTPGQAVALYISKGLICLGGGPIDGCGNSYHERGISLPQNLHPSGLNDLSILRKS